MITVIAYYSIDISLIIQLKFLFLLFIIVSHIIYSDNFELPKKIIMLLIYYFMVLERWQNNFDNKTTNLLSILYNISIINKEWKINNIDKHKWRILIAEFNLFWNDQIILLALLIQADKMYMLIIIKFYFSQI